MELYWNYGRNNECGHRGSIKVTNIRRAQVDLGITEKKQWKFI